MTSISSIGRQDLYKLVWSEALATLGPKFGITDVALKKRCKRLGVPTPPRGYWAKLEAGKPVKKPVLPDTVPPRAPSKKKRPEDLRFFAPKGNFMIRQAHPVTEATRKFIAGGSSQLSRGEVSLQADVSKGSSKRALWIIDAVLKGLEARGLEIKTVDGYKGGVFVHGFGEHARLVVREKHDRFENPDYDPERRYKYPDPSEPYLYLPNGLLKINAKLSYYDPSELEWRDRRTQPLNERIDEVAAGLLEGLRSCQEQRERHRLERIAEDAERERARQRQREIDAERKRLDNLEATAAALTASKEVLHLVAMVVERAAEMNLTEPHLKKLEIWVRWATEHGNRLDPVNMVLGELGLVGFLSTVDVTPHPEPRPRSKEIRSNIPEYIWMQRARGNW